MVHRRRDILLILLIFGLVVVAFAAGFLLNEIIDLRTHSVHDDLEDGGLAIFWEAWNRVERSYIGALPSDEQITYGAVRGSLESLGDPYTIFVEPVARDEERDALRGNFGGVGANLEFNDSGQVVLSPIPGNPAETAGILDGDILLAVDGQELPAKATLEEVANLVRGEIGTEVTLTVLHPGQDQPTDVVIVRAQILLPSVTYRILEEEPTIGYIYLNRFSGESSGEVAEAITALSDLGATKLILDMRHNGGGLLDAAVDVSDLFLDKGPVVYQIGRGNSEKEYSAKNDTLAGDVPLVVLVDGGTASAAEIVAGALQDRDRATLIGTKTFGKGSVQLVFDLSDGSSVHVTSARWLTPDRHQIDQQGLEPDIVIQPSEDAIAAGRDEILEEAVAYLKNVVVR